jgi:hypothetical protein
MEQNLKRFLLLICVSLSFVLATVLTTLGYVTPALRLTFTTYQFFLVGVCVGALSLATVGLILERDEWTHYRMYFIAVMASVFLLTVINCVIFRVLGGEHFIRNLVKALRVFIDIG